MLPELGLDDLDAPRPARDPPPSEHPGVRLHGAARHCAGVVHQTLAIVLPALHPELREALPLLRYCLAHENGGQDIARLSAGLSVALPVRSDWQDPSLARAALVLSTCALARHQGEAVAMLGAAVRRLTPGDPARLREILVRARAGLAAEIPARGDESARYVAAAAAGGAAALRAAWNGLGALNRLDELLADPSAAAMETSLDRVREVTDAMWHLQDYAFLACACGTTLKVPPVHAGRQIPCPHCGTPHRAADTPAPG